MFIIENLCIYLINLIVDSFNEHMFLHFTYKFTLLTYVHFTCILFVIRYFLKKNCYPNIMFPILWLLYKIRFNWIIYLPTFRHYSMYFMFYDTLPASCNRSVNVFISTNHFLDSSTLQIAYILVSSIYNLYIDWN